MFYGYLIGRRETLNLRKRCIEVFVEKYLFIECLILAFLLVGPDMPSRMPNNTEAFIDYSTYGVLSFR